MLDRIIENLREGVKGMGNGNGNECWLRWVLGGKMRGVWGLVWELV